MVDQLRVESVRPAEAPRDTVMRALDVAHRLVTATTGHRVMASLVGYACRELRADWAAVVDNEGGRLLAQAGSVPSAEAVAHLAAQIGNRPSAGRSEQEAVDTASLPIPGVRRLWFCRGHNTPCSSTSCSNCVASSTSRARATRR